MTAKEQFVGPSRRTLPTPVVGVLLLLLVATVAPAGIMGVTPAPAPAPFRAEPILELQPHPSASPAPIGLGVGRFPVILGRPAAVTNPTSLYPSEPAPMGIGDFGVTPSLTAYSYSTPELMGNFTWNSQSISNTSLGSAAEDLYSVQLNVFLEFVDGGKTYYWWIQDVATMNTKTLLLQMMDCVWNATTSSATVPTSGTLTGNGSVSGGVYSDDSTTAPGGSITTLAKSSFALVIVSKKDTSGRPEVLLEYVDSGTAGKVVAFDTVDFVFAKSTTSDSNFIVNGNAQDVWGTAYDAEIMVGGPYNGDFTVAHNPTNLNMQLYRWNGHNFEAPQAAWNFGSETAESISSISTTFVNDGYGIPSDALYNGTAHDATTGALYSSSQVGVLTINDPSLASGTVAVGAGQTPFTGNTAWLTLVPGTYHVWVNGTSSTDLGMCTITAGGNLTVNAPTACSASSSGPSITSFTVAPNPDTLGTSVTFTTVATGGVGALTYSYTGFPTGCSSTNTSTITCTPSVTGKFPVNVTATDTLGSSAMASVVLTVNPVSPPTLTVTNLSATPDPVVVGNSVTLATTASGGVGPLTYVYTNLPSPCATSNASTLRCTPATVGNYTITVTVHDSEATPQTGSTTVLLVVTKAPTPPLKIVSFVAWPNPVEVDQKTSLYTNTTGGDGWTLFNYTGLPPGCVSMITSTLPCTPTEAGTYPVTVAAWTNATDWVWQTLTLTVDLPPGPSISGFTDTPATITLGQTTTLLVTASGGFGKLSFAYTELPAGCSNESVTSLPCTPEVRGSFPIKVTVRDAAGRTASQTVSLTVNPVALSSVSLSASPAEFAVGSPTTFTASASGGVEPYTFAYTDLPAGCASPGNVSSFSCSPTGPGWYNVTLSLSDPASQSGTATATIHVLARQGSGSSGIFGSLSTTDLVVAVVVVVALIAVLSLAAARRRRPVQETPEAWEEPPQEWGPPPGSQG